MKQKSKREGMNRHHYHHHDDDDSMNDDLKYCEPPAHHRREKTKAINKRQARYISSIESNTITFGLGPAGVGKSYVAAALAAEALADKRINRIIVTRPTVEVGESLGFLPGELSDKFAPYIAPVRDVLQHILGPGHLGYALRHNKIVPIPLSLMRGMSLDDSWILLDEAQNSTPVQMKMFLTRIGRNSRAIINGDLEQSDLPRGAVSGLEDAVMRFGDDPEIGVVHFDDDDCVRSGIVRRILEGYR
jgi:phosphate starvation-inducible PhoH-like protein